MSVPDYKIVIKDIVGNTIGEFNRWSNLKFSTVLNKEGACSFDISVYDPKATSDMISINRREVYIYRNNVLVWGGDMVQINGKANGTDDVMTIQCVGFLKRLAYRVVGYDTEYNSINQATIAWDLINTSQALSYGDFGITEGTLSSSVTRSVKFNNKTIYDCLTQMNGLDSGIDFEITPSKVFNAFDVKGSDKSSSIIFKDHKNVSEVDFINDGSNMFNQIVVLGSGYGTSMLTEIINDTVYQEAFLLRQENFSAKDLNDSASLTDAGNKELILKRVELRQFNITQIPGTDPDFTSIETGDYIKVDARYGYIQLANVVRVRSIEVSVNANEEDVAYTFVNGY